VDASVLFNEDAARRQQSKKHTQKGSIGGQNEVDEKFTCAAHSAVSSF
jgi:hypothetical protein